MARTQTLVQLSDSLLAVLDQQAAQRGISRSELIRQALEAHLGQAHDAELARRIVAGYTRVPQTDEEAAWAVASTREMIAEEPW